MIVKLVEVYETTSRRSNAESSYSLREVYVNPDHIVSMREDMSTKSKLTSGLLPENLSRDQEFTKLFINRGTWGSAMIVIGSPSSVHQKLRGKGLLKG